MAASIAQQLAAAADLLRPRTLLRALSRVDQITAKTRALEETAEALRQRTEQLETIAKLDWELQAEIARLPTLLDPEPIEAHVRKAVSRAELVMDPFPHVVKTVPFRANTLLAFLNSRGAHGASIPADAQPADLERYVYQFRIGPSAQSMQQLYAAMPAERQVNWAGGKALKAGRRSSDLPR